MIPPARPPLRHAQHRRALGRSSLRPPQDWFQSRPEADSKNRYLSRGVAYSRAPRCGWRSGPRSRGLGNSSPRRRSLHPRRLSRSRLSRCHLLWPEDARWCCWSPVPRRPESPHPPQEMACQIDQMARPHGWSRPARGCGRPSRQPSVASDSPRPRYLPCSRNARRPGPRRLPVRWLAPPALSCLADRCPALEAVESSVLVVPVLAPRDRHGLAERCVSPPFSDCSRGTGMAFVVAVGTASGPCLSGRACVLRQRQLTTPSLRWPLRRHSPARNGPSHRCRALVAERAPCRYA